MGDRRLWGAWGLVIIGGLAVIAAVAVALWHPCMQDGQAFANDGCTTSAAPTVVMTLTAGGTLLAVAGGLTAAFLMVRRPAR